MDFIAFARILIKGVSTAQKLQRLFSDELGTLLRSVGDIHYQAAALALTDSQLSQDPRREIESTITHLRAAYQARANLRMPTADDHCKSIGALCGIAACYKYAGEFDLMNSYLDLAAQAMHNWCRQIDDVRLQGVAVRGAGVISHVWINRKYVVGHDEAHRVWETFDETCRNTTTS